MSYKLCITEKPSVARDIARILGADARHDGYFEGNGYCVTWTFGHLCELKEPADYTEAWKHWSLSALPMIPERQSKLVETAADAPSPESAVSAILKGAREAVSK